MMLVKLLLMASNLLKTNETLLGKLLLPALNLTRRLLDPENDK